jgi:hypothetical protein
MHRLRQCARKLDWSPIARFQGRFSSVTLDDEHLVAAARYVVPSEGAVG